LSSEVVVLVVFDTSTKIGDRLTAEQFPTKRLGRGEISLARQNYATLESINEYVIKGRPIVGVATSVVDSIRAIGRGNEDTKAPRILRSVCVIDKVESGDHDSHASLKACDDQELMSPTRRGKVRGALAAELARKFGPIQEIGAIFKSAALSSAATPKAQA
jgi:hypothetical protein